MACDDSAACSAGTGSTATASDGVWITPSSISGSDAVGDTSSGRTTSFSITSPVVWGLPVGVGLTGAGGSGPCAYVRLTFNEPNKSSARTNMWHRVAGEKRFMEFLLLV